MRARRLPTAQAYIAAEDDNGATAYHRVNNLVPAVAALRFRTAETAPPTWESGYPAVSDVGATAG